MGAEFIDNSGRILYELARRKVTALNAIGDKAEDYAAKLCPVGTPESVGSWAHGETYRGGTLKGSITHAVDGDVLSVGSSVKYAPYVELGTGPHFKPPPEWEQFDSKRGKGVGKAYVKPRPFLRPAIEDHVDEYEEIIERVLRGE